MIIYENSQLKKFYYFIIFNFINYHKISAKNNLIYEKK